MALLFFFITLGPGLHYLPFYLNLSVAMYCTEIQKCSVFLDSGVSNLRIFILSSEIPVRSPGSSVG